MDNRRDQWPLAKPASERRLALLVVLVFLVAGSLWILFTDLLLYSLIQDPIVIARIETAKGWAFVALAAFLLYVVTLRAGAKLAKATRTISKVLESIGDGVLLLGTDRTIAHANPAAVRMLKVKSVDELRGMGAPEFSRRFRVSYPDGHLVPPDQFVSQRVFDEEGTLQYNAVLYPEEGSELDLSCTAAGVRSEVGRAPELVVSIMHDITASEHLERLRDDLFAETAHAIKTPITVIKSASQMLSAAAPPQSLPSAKMIERQCLRIERLVENLLALSRIRSGTLQLHPVEVELGPVIEDVARQVKRVSNGHDILVHLDGPVQVHADRERLVMVLRNAIDAAVRTARPATPVTIQLDRSGSDGEIAVSFRPSVSTDLDDTFRKEAEFDDLGVGRYVTTTIIEAHGGSFTEQFDDAVNTIRIRLPAISESRP